MAEVTETQLPGVGVRHDFTTGAGEHVGVISHRGNRREVLIYDREDPDACSSVLHLNSDDTHTLAELLGGSQISEALAAVEQQIEGLSIEWIQVGGDSPFAARTIADGEFRTRTGASIVAVARNGDTFPSPKPDFTFRPDDVVIAVGTSEGLEELRSLFDS